MIETRRLKTIEKLKEEFGDDCFSDFYMSIRYKGKHIHFNTNMIKRLGTVMKFERIKGVPVYTHRGENGWYYHEICFEPELEDFIKEEEFKI